MTMTAQEQQAANLEVAEAMGWKLSETRSLMDAPMFYNGSCLQTFDMFAPTAHGASAREECEEWLLDQGWEIAWSSLEINGTKHIKYHCVDVPEGACGSGATMAEARAAAIVAAVKAWKEGAK